MRERYETVFHVRSRHFIYVRERLTRECVSERYHICTMWGQINCSQTCICIFFYNSPAESCVVTFPSRFEVEFELARNVDVFLSAAQPSARGGEEEPPPQGAQGRRRRRGRQRYAQPRGRPLRQLLHRQHRRRTIVRKAPFGSLGQSRRGSTQNPKVNTRTNKQITS